MCLDYFMKQDLQLSLLGRTSRISCVKGLVTGLEERKLFLLREEVHHSLEHFEK